MILIRQDKVKEKFPVREFYFKNKFSRSFKCTTFLELWLFIDKIALLIHKTASDWNFQINGRVSV
jgi:hypothetical protein